MWFVCLRMSKIDVFIMNYVYVYMCWYNYAVHVCMHIHISYVCMNKIAQKTNTRTHNQTNKRKSIVLDSWMSVAPCVACNAGSKGSCHIQSMLMFDAAWLSLNIPFFTEPNPNIRIHMCNHAYNQKSICHCICTCICICTATLNTLGRSVNRYDSSQVPLLLACLDAWAYQLTIKRRTAMPGE